MGFCRRIGLIHLRCDNCEETATQRLEDAYKLKEEGWEWGDNGNNYALCGDCNEVVA